MSNVLVIVAHPDDEVIGCGGTIAKHIQNGDRVKVIFLADGFSSREDDVNRNKCAGQASKILGCEKPCFLNFPDNQLDTVPLLNIVKEVEKHAVDFEPNIIYTHHFGDLNVDHQITHKVVMTAFRLQPKVSTREIYSFETLSATHWQSHSMGGVFNPNCFVDIEGFTQAKIQALHCYDSEIRSYPHARSYEVIESLERFRGGMAGVKRAEAFCVERLVK